MTASHVIPEPRTTTDTDSWDLVAAAQAGDSEAFGQLYERYVEMVFGFVLAKTGNRNVADDLTSETFARALRRLSSVSYQGRDVGAWFMTIARNLIIDRAKSSRYKLEITTPDILDAHPKTSGADHEVIQRATTRVVLAALEKLTGPQRECVFLRHILGMSVAEVAAAVGCNQEAAKARTHRGLMALAEDPSLRAWGVVS